MSLFTRCGTAAVLVVGAFAIAPPAGAVVQPGTQTFTSTGAEQTFVVPAGVTSLRVTAVGGRGGTGYTATGGGFGARVTGAVAVTPGQTLYVEVAANGTDGGPAFNGGGAGGSGVAYGGTGGGASDVRTAPRTAGDTLTTRLLVAAGGGGAGGVMGTGGAAGAAGGNGNFAFGGGAGTGSSGGAGGAGQGGGQGTPGGAGALGLGGGGGAGPGGGTGGGGGGGGLFGGGGGGGSQNTGGGGGGGSSLVPAGGTLDADTTGAPSITLDYDLQPTVTLAPNGVTFGLQRLSTTSPSQRVTVTNSGGAPLTVGAVSITGANVTEFAADSGCPAQLAPGASCPVFVRFTPSTSGTRTASLTVATDAPGGASPMVLVGNGYFVTGPLLPPPAPALTALKLSRTTFRPATRGASISATARSTTVTYRLSRAAKVTFRVTQRRRVRGRMRTVVLGSFSVTDRRAGAQRHTFRGRVKGRAVKPGRYVLQATPAGGKGVTTGFRVARR